MIEHVSCATLTWIKQEIFYWKFECLVINPLFLMQQLTHGSGLQSIDERSGKTAGG